MEHNNILDTVFSWIEFAYLNEELDGKTSDEDLLEFVEDLVIQYKDEKYTTGSQTDSALTDLVELTYNDHTAPYDEDIISIQMNSLQGSSRYLTLVEGLNYVTNLSDTSIANYLDQVDSILVLALDLEDDQEREIMCIALAIAKHSSQYWYHNFDKWESLIDDIKSSFGNGPVIKARWGGWGQGGQCAACDDIAKDDIAYGASGALVGALFGTVTIPGIGTVAGWIAGGISGGAGASIGNGIRRLLGNP